MNSRSERPRTQLPLRKKEKLEHPRDWVSLWQALSTKGAAVLLESAGPIHDASRWVVLAGDPEIEYFEKGGQPHLNDEKGLRPGGVEVFSFLDGISLENQPAALHLGQVDRVENENPHSGQSPFLPFPYGLSGAWFGLFSYEFGRRFGRRNSTNAVIGGNPVPDYYFFKPRVVIAFDRREKEVFYFGGDFDERFSEIRSNRQPFLVHSLQSHSSLENYKFMVDKVKAYIGLGDIYQANIAQAFRARWEGNPGSLYRLLREMNPGPFMGVFQGRGFTVVSSSPERLASGQGDWMEVRPIAGTRPRGKDLVQDLQLRWELKTNAKEQAEHLMLVDLARNDLGRVAGFGTVEVKSFAEVESYAKVHHLVSVIRARRGNRVPFSEILKSVFPGGTITGCPKVRCMEIIWEIEKGTRGYYTGSMGYVAPGPCFDLNILIRSITLLPDGSLEFCAGAGIVADSEPEKEYLETLYKVEALAQAMGSSLLKKS